MDNTKNVSIVTIAREELRQSIYDALIGSPYSTYQSIADVCGVSRAYVAQIARQRGIRRVKGRPAGRTA
jgi:hypothetical protein